MFRKKIDGSYYLNVKPYFDFKEYFTGELNSWGIVQNSKGKIINRFDLKMIGEWEGSRGRLQEDFTYYDGSTESRVWNILNDNGNLTATAYNIIGKATHTNFGNATRWQYVMEVLVSGRGYKLQFDDWMWLLNDNTVINRSYMSKFGIHLAEISIFIKK